MQSIKSNQQDSAQHTPEDSTESSNCAPTRSKKMGMYLQDPSLPHLYENYEFSLEKDYLHKMGSSRVTIVDTDTTGRTVYEGPDWNAEADLSFQRFEQDGLVDNPQFHQVNTFAVLNHALDFVEAEIGHTIAWKDNKPLVVRPHAFAGKNAFYTPTNPSLSFGYDTSLFLRTPVWTCLSHDIVVHELGHAILDTFRPLYISAFHPDTPAFHESFSDLLAMFDALSHQRVVEYLYKETNGNMRDHSLITSLGEEFGQGIFGAGKPYLRSALSGPPYSQAPRGPHARSTVWTAAVYDILEQLVKISYSEVAEHNGTSASVFSEALVKACTWLRGMLLRALHYTPPNGLTMPMLARLIVAADSRVYPHDSRLRDIAKDVFVRRELWDESIDLTVSDPSIGQSFRELQEANSTELSRMIMQHAETFRIPKTSLRLTAPRLITTTRQIDKVTEGDMCSMRTITEHYLEFAYEQLESVVDGRTGQPVPLSMYGGGTLVMDEDWNAQLLATYPQQQQSDPPKEEGVATAWRRSRDAFNHTYPNISELVTTAQEDIHSSPNTKAPPINLSQMPFSLQQSETGAYRLLRRGCNLHEHINGICYATDRGLIQPSLTR